jgi:hypothetical protein
VALFHRSANDPPNHQGPNHFSANAHDDVGESELIIPNSFRTEQKD